MIKTTPKHQWTRLMSILGALVFTCLSAASGYASNLSDLSEKNSNTSSSTYYKKKIYLKNEGNCATDVYSYSRYGCRYQIRLEPGEIKAFWSYVGKRYRFVDAGASNLNNLKYDKFYRVGSEFYQTVRLTPEYCEASCDLSVDAGEDVSSCTADEITLTAAVSGASNCDIEAESDCNHKLYQQGGYCSRYYPASNAAYCGRGKGAKLWTKAGWGVSFVTLDFGKVVPAGTKIHARMKLEHCSNSYIRMSNAKIEASLNGDRNFELLTRDLQFSSTSYKEYTYTLSSPARYVKVTDNGACSFLLDYVRYEIEGSSNNEVSYTWSGPGIVSANNQAQINVNKAGTYTVTVKDCTGNCTATDTVEVTTLTPLTDAGKIKKTQKKCGAFTPKEFTGTEATGGNAGDIVYQWQIKKDRNTGSWENIDGANGINYQAAAIESGSLWYRRAAKRENCGEYIYSNSVDLHSLALPEVTVTSQNGTCEDENGNITFSFEDTINRTNIEFSLDGGVNYKKVSDASGAYTFENLAAGTYDLWVRWGNDQCPVELEDVTITTILTPVLTDAGKIEKTQKNCGGFTPEEFTGTEASGDGANEITYQWQVKRDRNTGSWEDIDGADGINYQAPYIDAGSLWYRRAAINGVCGEYSYSNSIDLHVLTPPTVAVTSQNGTCEDENGNITFTFDDTEGRTNIEFSIDGGSNYTTVSDDSGTFSFENLTAGSYDIWVRWGNDECAVDLGFVTIIQENTVSVDLGPDQSICDGQDVTLVASVQGEGTCTECVEYKATNTDYCRGNHNFVAWMKTNDGQRRWFSNIDLVWKENNDGTATLKGKMYDYFFSKKEFMVDVIYSGKTVIPPTESPKEHFCNNEDSSGWEYYTELTGTVTEIGGPVVFDLSIRGAAFQSGVGANVYETTPGVDGASGWFDMEGDYPGIGDFNINFGECITTQSNGFEYLWSTGETTESITVAPSETTNYTVTVSNCAACVDTDEITVFVGQYSVDAGSDQTIDQGATATLTATANNADSYTWSNGDTSATINVTPTETTTYTVTATKDGCTATDQVTVSVEESLVKSSTDPCLSQQYAVKVTPNPIRTNGIMNLDIAVDTTQEIIFETYRFDGNKIGPSIPFSLDAGCNSYEIDLGTQGNFLPTTTYIVKVTGNGWTESVQFLTL